jgi:hypothetical protein
LKEASFSPEEELLLDFHDVSMGIALSILLAVFED